MDSAVKQER